MRLDRLDLTRYGRFTDQSLSFDAPAPGSPDLHIVYGPNEAGKSTLFSAWLDLLFGFGLRTRYDFLHPAPTLQIGAQLSHAGQVMELRRLKRNKASLFDAHGAALPEASLQALLGGLSREGYAAMFSLDDDTLVKGGETILDSKGDLGEMLFSASAGLAGLAPQLEAERARLDGFHRSGKRSGWLYDAKKQLAELEKQRRELEVSAGALQKLSREATASEAEWREARAREEEAQSRLDHLQELAATLPLLERLAALEAELTPLSKLPDATPTHRESFERLDAARRELESRQRDRGLRLRALQSQQNALPKDPAVLAQRGAIEAAEALRAEHDAAQKDLPRRREEAASAQHTLSLLAAELGQAGVAPLDLVLPPPRLAALRALLAERSGLQGAQASTAEEHAKAAALLARETERLGDPGPLEDDDVLASRVARLRAQDPAEALARAERQQDEAAQMLRATFAALAPWQGSAQDLARLPAPEDDRLRGLDEASEAARQTVLDSRRALEAVDEDLARLEADQARRGALPSPSLAEAARARGRRESLWAAHLQQLSAESAAAFEAALREDDQISARIAEALAEARQDGLAQAARATLLARRSKAEAALHSAEARSAELATEIRNLGQSLGLGDCGLSALRSWIARRGTALDAAQQAERAEAQTQRARDALATAAQSLAEALGQPVGPGGYEGLLALALSRIEAAARRREARARLIQLAADLREREASAARAEAELAAWRAAWQAAVQESPLAQVPDHDPGMGARLDVLDRLGAEARNAASLLDRIAKMEANAQRFDAARAPILTTLALPAETPWPDLLLRLRKAEDAARDAETLGQQIAQESRAEAEDQAALAANRAETEALGAALGWAESPGEASGLSLAQHLAACLRASSLRGEIAALERDLRDRPRPERQGAEVPGTTPRVDEAGLRAEMAGLRAEVQLLRSDAEARLAAHLDARRKLEAVGGDDALARIASTRENLLLEMRERAETHLADRFGMIALEAALRRYRDHHRSAMLTRASEAFTALSQGAYAGLAAQPDGAQEVLVALSAGGGAKLAADLSKGARFQLYLALRIAGYHELALSRPTVPFVADDIMETFDDGRSAAAFGLLGQMAQVGQVIYLTHHRHLCDIATEVCPGARVIDLSRAG